MRSSWWSSRPPRAAPTLRFGSSSAGGQRSTSGLPPRPRRVGRSGAVEPARHGVRSAPLRCRIPARRRRAGMRHGGWGGRSAPVAPGGVRWLRRAARQRRGDGLWWHVARGALDVADGRAGWVCPLLQPASSRYRLVTPQSGVSALSTRQRDLVTGIDKRRSTRWSPEYSRQRPGLVSSYIEGGRPDIQWTRDLFHTGWSPGYSQVARVFGEGRPCIRGQPGRGEGCPRVLGDGSPESSREGDRPMQSGPPAAGGSVLASGPSWPCADRRQEERFGGRTSTSGPVA